MECKKRRCRPESSNQGRTRRQRQRRCSGRRSRLPRPCRGADRRCRHRLGGSLGQSPGSMWSMMSRNRHCLRSKWIIFNPDVFFFMLQLYVTTINWDSRISSLLSCAIEYWRYKYKRSDTCGLRDGSINKVEADHADVRSALWKRFRFYYFSTTTTFERVYLHVAEDDEYVLG